MLPTSDGASNWATEASTYEYQQYMFSWLKKVHYDQIFIDY